jgi:short subunit dehydrogenase-like uncharacterized protein
MQAKTPHRPILVYGAYGHTARFIIEDLLSKGLHPVLAGRDHQKLETVSSAHGRPEVRVASIEDPVALDRALEGVDAVINAAGPFASTALPLLAAAIRARVPYLDIAAEPDVVAATIEQLGEHAWNAGVAVAPAVGFYGGLGNLLATAAMGDWRQADKITLAYSLSSWIPTLGTRKTINVADERRGGQRLVFTNHQLQLRNDEAAIAEWDFPAPVGRQPVATEFTTADAVTISRHLKTQSISGCITLAPLKDLSGPDLSNFQAVDSRGRSDQTFLIEAVAHSGTRQRRAIAHGQDIYAVTAPLVVQALLRLLEQPQRWRGIVTTGELGNARSFLAALVPQHLTVTL